MLSALINLTIRETETALRRTFGYRIMVDRRVIVDDQRLSVAESQILRGLCNQYSSLYGGSSGAAPLVLEQQRAVGVALFNLWLQRAWPQIDRLIPRGMRRILTVDSDLAEILALPWTLLRPPGGDFLCRDPLFSLRYCPRRTIATASEVVALPPAPLRLLFMASAPPELGAADSAREEAGIMRATLASPDVMLELGQLGTWAEFQYALRSFQPQMVHLAAPVRLGRRCHGCGEVAAPHADRCRSCGAGLGLTPSLPYIAFEDGTSAPDWRSAADLRHQFSSTQVRCLWVNDPQPTSPASIAAVPRLCHALVAPTLPMAIGWACSLGVDQAARMAAGFYHGLASGMDVDAALSRAHNTGRRRALAAWPAPVCYSITPNAAVIDPSKVVDRPLASSADRSAWLLGRRHELQQLLPDLQGGGVHTLLITGAAGSGKTTLLRYLARTMVASDRRVLTIASNGRLPLTAARLLVHCARALPLESAAQLLDGGLPLSQRLERLATILDRDRRVLVLDGFEHALDQATGRIRDPWIAMLCSTLLYQPGGGLRAIITSRALPTDFVDLPPTARTVDLPHVGEATTQAVLLADALVARRVEGRDLSPWLLHAIQARLDGDLHSADLLRPALRDIETTRLCQAVASASSARTLAEAALGWLYERLDPDARTALGCAAAFDVPVDLADLAALLRCSVEQMRRVASRWRDVGLAAPVDGERWLVTESARAWVLVRLDPSDRRRVHRAAGDLLRAALPNELPDKPIEIDRWLAARDQLLAAGELAAARATTDRLCDALAEIGLYDDCADQQSRVFGYEAHPGPLLWLARMSAARADDVAARLWWTRAAGLADRFPALAAEALRGLAAIERRQRDLSAAQACLERALRCSEQAGDESGVAVALAQLGLIAAQIDRQEAGLRLVALGGLLLRRLRDPQGAAVGQWIGRMASGLSAAQFRHMLHQVAVEYRQHHGWNLVRAAFYE